MFQDLADTTSVASVVERFALLEVAQSRHLQAVRLAGAAAAQRSAAGASLSQPSQAKLDRALAPSWRALGDMAAVAWREGQKLSLAEAIADAQTPHSVSAEARDGALRSRSDHHSTTALTAREEEVAALIARGLTNRQIGEMLVITEGTVASHVVHILGKLGFNSRAQVAVWAAEHNVRRSTAI
jgi:non-specific serine/threonine protein kinase